MIYRRFGKTGMDVSAVSFGAMRLPTEEVGDKHVVKADEAVAVVHRAFELGVNYIDTGHGYCWGQSEPLFGRFLDGWRERVFVSTKSPVWKLEGRADYRKTLELQLRTMGLEYLDLYYLHGLSWKNLEEKVRPWRLDEEAERAKRDGLIRHVGFSCHDTPTNIVRLVDEGWAEAMLVQYNLLDQKNAPAIAHAAGKGLGVAIMGPVGGGRLRTPTPALRKLLPGGTSSMPELALRFVLANPDVSCALSGMGSLAMVEQNAAVGSRGDAALSVPEMRQVQAAAAELKKLADLYCTGCNYCMPCPNGVNIPRCFELLNHHRVYGLTDHARRGYRRLKPESRADKCVECGQCEEKCPQKIEIRRQLKEVHEVLGQAVDSSTG